MSNRITLYTGFRQQASIVREVFAVNELVHISIHVPASDSFWRDNNERAVNARG